MTPRPSTKEDRRFCDYVVRQLGLSSLIWSTAEPLPACPMVFSEKVARTDVWMQQQDALRQSIHLCGDRKPC